MTSRRAAGLLISAPCREDGTAAYALILRGPQAKNYHWHWDLPGGSLEDGEDPLAGAFREAREEAGIQPDAVNVQRVLSERDFGTHVYTVFGASADAMFPLVTEVPGEVAGCGWFTAAECQALRLHPNLLKELEAMGFWQC